MSSTCPDASSSAPPASACPHEILLSTLSDTIPTAALCVDSDGTPIWNNQQWEAATGRSVSGGIEALLKVVDRPEDVAQQVAAVIDSGAPADLDVMIDPSPAPAFRAALKLRPVGRGNESYRLLLTLDVVIEPAPTAPAVSDGSDDAPHRRDDLTIARNGSAIRDFVHDALRQGNGPWAPPALLWIDLDNFVSINETWGRTLGDQVLQTVAERIGELLRPADALGRVEGAQFCAVLVGMPTNDDVAAIRKRIEEELPALAIRFREPVAISAAIGVGAARADDDADALMRRARAAAQIVKQARSSEL